MRGCERMTWIESTSSTAWRCGALLLGTLLPAQANWTQRSPATSPSARSAHAMAWDSTGGVVLFGGYSGNGYLNDTWQWDGSTWTQRNTSPSPAARAGHSMVYDATRACVVLFGGGSGSTSYSDTWEWNGTSWSQRSPATSPAARAQHKMAYDSARRRVVLFGGGSGSTRFSDTWDWDGTNWTLRNPATSPLARFWHAMAYDATRDRVVLFGGWSGGQLGDTWEWDGTNWAQSYPAASPGIRVAHAMAYDSVRGRVVLFGGRNNFNVSVADTWEWDGTNWSQHSPATSPPGRQNHAIAYDSARGRLVVFGGAVNGSLVVFGDTWEHGVPNPAIYTPFGPGCAGSVGVPTNTASALPRIGQTLTANVGNLPLPELAFFVIGTSRTTSALGPLPLDLAAGPGAGSGPERARSGRLRCRGNDDRELTDGRGPARDPVRTARSTACLATAAPRPGCRRTPRRRRDSDRCRGSGPRTAGRAAGCNRRAR